ncbi:hypothetical protein D9611_009960 [Ephemerocybe angulata]|uniref:Uncharacterized protein n=1 Tax=Ephemerocybe angulata TaxID=980116 RepID=A0A8H5FFS9_9AGAR|nr:hypothetical protein D9611_009960 [Tulosesus angulatus]
MAHRRTSTVAGLTAIKPHVARKAPEHSNLPPTMCPRSPRIQSAYMRLTADASPQSNTWELKSESTTAGKKTSTTFQDRRRPPKGRGGAIKFRKPSSMRDDSLPATQNVGQPTTLTEDRHTTDGVSFATCTAAITTTPARSPPHSTVILTNNGTPSLSSSTTLSTPNCPADEGQAHEIKRDDDIRDAGPSKQSVSKNVL